MIGKLKGLVDSVASDHVIIDVGGVGYIAFASNTTLSHMPQAGHAVSLLIETHVREDHIHLYGFSTVEERDWFKILTTVQGVGSKVALGILGHLSPAQLASALIAQDKTLLQRADGVGPKLAARLITELKDKVPAIGLSAPQMVGGSALPMPTNDNQVLNDAVSALVNLGYGRADAHLAASKILERDQAAELSAVIRQSLQQLSQGLR